MASGDFCKGEVWVSCHLQGSMGVVAGSESEMTLINIDGGVDN